MKKELLNNTLLRGIQTLLLSSEGSYRMIALLKNLSVIELTEVEAKQLIKQRGTLLLNFGDMNKASWLHFADGYSVPLDPAEQMTVKRFFNEGTGSLDDLLRIWESKQDCSIIRRERI